MCVCVCVSVCLYVYSDCVLAFFLQLVTPILCAECTRVCCLFLQMNDVRVRGFYTLGQASSTVHVVDVCAQARLAVVHALDACSGTFGSSVYVVGAHAHLAVVDAVDACKGTFGRSVYGGCMHWQIWQ
jgi:hypothetical protein